VVLGSRILGKGALKGGMPVYKYIINRLLKLIQNILMGQKLSEYHTGYRAFSARVLKSIDYNNNSNDFVFDNQILAQLCFLKYRIGEIYLFRGNNPGLYKSGRKFWYTSGG